MRKLKKYTDGIAYKMVYILYCVFFYLKNQGDKAIKEIRLFVDWIRFKKSLVFMKQLNLIYFFVLNKTQPISTLKLQRGGNKFS